MRIRTVIAVLPAIALAVGLSGCVGGGGDSSGMEPVPVPDSVVVDNTDREIIRNAQMSMRVDDVRATVAQVTQISVAAGGRIASQNVNASGEALFADITARVPAGELDAVIAEIGDLGTVTSLTVTADDVTAQGIDLDARIAALQGSIDRLKELLAQAETTADLIEIESELTTRQAELDSLVAQRAALSEAVALSTLSIFLSPSSELAEWTPPGFLSGLESGWSALRTTIGGLITALGFLLPFIVVALVIAIPIIVLSVALHRRKR
jgi:hypothetical protein